MRKNAKQKRPSDDTVWQALTMKAGLHGFTRRTFMSTHHIGKSDCRQHKAEQNP